VIWDIYPIRGAAYGDLELIWKLLGGGWITLLVFSDYFADY